MSLTRRLSATALLALVMTLSACSSTPDTYEDHNFNSLEEFAKVVEDADWGCSLADDQAKTDNSLYKYGFDSSPCNRGALIIYASEAKRVEISRLPQNALEVGKAKLDGGNWSVVGDQFKVEDAMKILGGKLTVA